MHICMCVGTWVSSITMYKSGSIFLTLNCILQDGSLDPDSLSSSDSNVIEPLPGLETILEELLQEDGYVFNFITF